MKNNLSKKGCQVTRIALCACLCFFTCVLFCSCAGDSFRGNDVPITINSVGYSYPNAMQRNTDIKMQVIESGLYIYMPSFDWAGPSVYRFDQNGAAELENMIVTHLSNPLWNDSVLAFCNGYMYLIRHPEKDNETVYPKKAELIAVDLTTGSCETLISTLKSSDMRVELDENGQLHVSTDEISTEEELLYQVIRENTLFPDKTPLPLNNRKGAASAVLKNYNSASSMLTEDQLNAAIASLTELGLENKSCVLYPFEGGWLLYMDGGNSPLCLVSPDGSVSPIIAYECFGSSTSFNFYGDYAFLSLVRYEKWDDEWGYFLERYENDTISGTYRIDLTDFSITKINDSYYCGMFMFDEGRIFVCDLSEGVYQMDYDGNLISTLVEPNK